MELNNKDLTIKKVYQEEINVNDFLNDDSENREFIGVQNGFYYCTELDQYSEYNPRDMYNLWYLIGVNSVAFDYNARNIDDFNEQINNKFDINVDFDAIHERNNNSTDFVNDLKRVFDKNGLIIEPIEQFEHSLTRFSRGIGGGWDSGIGGFAIVSKSDLKEEYHHKIITSQDKTKALNILDYELDIFTDAYNGWVFDIVVYDSNLDLVDQLGGFYESDIDSMKKNKTLLNLMVSELDTSDVKAV